GRSGNAYGAAPRSLRSAVPVSPVAQAESAALSTGNGRPAARSVPASTSNAAASPVARMRVRRVEAPSPASTPDLLVTPRKVDALVSTPAPLTDPSGVARKAEALAVPPIALS